MGNFSPYWDGRLPILGIDDWFAGHRRDMVATGFFFEGAETFLLDGPRKPGGKSFALRSNLAARRRGRLGIQPGP